MTTSARDRLAALFGDMPLPVPPPTNVKTFAEQELEASKPVQSTATSMTSTQPAQATRPTMKPQTTSRADVFTSSDEEDDYGAAFKSKVTMKTGASKKSITSAPTTTKKTSQSEAKYAENLDLDGTFFQDLPKADKRGRPATGHFCPFNLVTKFPYKYMNDVNSRLSRHFFANGKIYRREWHLYYLHGPESSLRQALVLVPYDQVKSLIDEMAATFDAKIDVPKYPFTISFFNDGTPQPQLLGICHSRTDIDDCRASIPVAEGGHGEAPVDTSQVGEAAFADFKTKFENVHGATKKTNKSSTSKKKRAADYAVVIQSWCRSLSRAQRYFGLRPAPVKNDVVDEYMPWEEQVAMHAKTSGTIPATLRSLDVSKPAPFPFDKSPVLISIDVECYERGHHIITEVGISTLDTLDLRGLEPGEYGENWRQQIRSRHFRVEEYAHIRNTEFCRGDPEAFQFGKSEIVGLKDIGSAIDSCFEWPFSIQYKHKANSEKKSWDEVAREATDAGNASNTPLNGALALDKQAPENLQQGPKERTILLVGHGIRADLDFLRALDSTIFSVAAGLSQPAATYPPKKKIELAGLDTDSLRGAKCLNSIREAVDTAELYQILKQDQNTRSLASVLSNLEIDCFYLHNGGNDARYTMEALIALVIKARLTDDEKAAAQAAESAAASKAWNN